MYSKWWNLDQRIWQNKVARQAFISFALFWLLFIIGGIFLWQGWSHVYRLGYRWWQARQELAQEQQEKVILTNWNWNQVKQLAQLTGRAFPEKSNLQLILFALEEPARQHHFMVRKLSFDLGAIRTASAAAQPKRRRNKSGFETVAAELSAVGPEKELGAFLQALEEGLPLVSISRLSAHIQGDTVPPLVNIQLRLVMYFAGELPLPKKGKLTAKAFVLLPQEVKTVNILGTFADHSKNLFQKVGALRQALNEQNAKRQNPF